MSATRKIVFINRFFFPDESATSQILSDVTSHLACEGAKVCVITGNRSLHGSGILPRRDAVLGGVGVRRVPQVGGQGGSLVGKLIRLISFYPLALVELMRMVSPGDIVVAKTDPPLISVVAQVVAKLRGALLVNWLQDVYPEVAARLETPVVRGPVGIGLKAMRNWSLKSAAVNVVIGSLMARKLESEGISAGRVRIIPNWANEQELRPILVADSAARVQWGLKPSDFVLGYSGNLGRAHEAETLLGAAEHLAIRADIKFLFIGGGHELELLKEAVTKAGLKNFIFKPHQPREKLQDTLGAADAHWLSLRPELEGLIVPSKLYGILAAGRPVIAVTSSSGEVAQIIGDHRCGFTVDPGDAEGLAAVIVRLADDELLRRRTGERARHTSETLFSRETALESWSDLITSLAQTNEHAFKRTHGNLGV